MTLKIELEAAIKDAKAQLASAERALADWSALAENNVFHSMGTATSTIEEALRDEAHEDCQGAGNCGLECYTRDFMVDGVAYTGKLTVEYNRHDKTYYYIDSSDFTYGPKELAAA